MVAFKCRAGTGRAPDNPSNLKLRSLLHCSKPFSDHHKSFDIREILSQPDFLVLYSFSTDLALILGTYLSVTR